MSTNDAYPAPSHHSVTRNDVGAARIVAEHWLNAYTTHLADDRLRAVGTHALGCVLAALDGETAPEMLGIPEEHPDAERLRTLPPARTETADQLDALPAGAVVLDRYGTAWQPDRHDAHGRWVPADHGSPLHASELASECGPFTVLHRGGGTDG